MSEIKVTIISAKRDRKVSTIDDSTTPRQAFENVGIDYDVGYAQLDGKVLEASDFDRTFADMKVTEKCFLVTYTKPDYI